MVISRPAPRPPVFAFSYARAGKTPRRGGHEGGFFGVFYMVVFEA